MKQDLGIGIPHAKEDISQSFDPGRKTGVIGWKEQDFYNVKSGFWIISVANQKSLRSPSIRNEHVNSFKNGKQHILIR